MKTYLLATSLALMTLCTHVAAYEAIIRIENQTNYNVTATCQILSPFTPRQRSVRVSYSRPPYFIGVRKLRFESNQPNAIASGSCTLASFFFNKRVNFTFRPSRAICRLTITPYGYVNSFCF